jgi:hypothetical protein
MSGIFGLCKDGWIVREGRRIVAVCVLARREVSVSGWGKEARTSYEPELRRERVQGSYVSEFLSLGRCDTTASQLQSEADVGRGPEKNESCVRDISWP